MAAKRKTSTRQKNTEVSITQTSVFETPRSNFFNTKALTIILLVLALFALAYWKKNWFVSATVNGFPITSLELQQRLNENYRQQGLQDLIDEKIILEEASRARAISSRDETEAKYKELAQGYGGPEEFEKLLVAQGESKSGLLRRISLNLALDKMYAVEATATSKEVDEYIRVNRGLLKATTSAEQKTEAEQAIKEQKLLRVIQEKFQELKDRAVVKIF